MFPLSSSSNLFRLHIRVGKRLITLYYIWTILNSVWWRYMFIAADDPPRPSLHGDSVKDLMLIGYMPARGDFNVDYDNYAEMEICNIESSSTEDDLDKGLHDLIFLWFQWLFNNTLLDFLAGLKFAILDMYRMRLKERKRRHKIIRDHGLINMSKQFTAWYQYENTLGRGYIQKLARFTQLFASAVDYETYIEGIHGNLYYYCSYLLHMCWGRNGRFQWVPGTDLYNN